MTDLVERLRKQASLLALDILEESADEIERLLGEYEQITLNRDYWMEKSLGQAREIERLQSGGISAERSTPAR